MAFKTMSQYNEEKFGGLFLLRNDQDFADVIFLYRSSEDALIADTHYIKSSDYTGYVHCCGKGCAACGKGIRVQTKLFIPLYNIQAHEVQFWDRNVRFESQLVNDVFSRYPDPSGFVFRIQRHGAAGDINTTYSITAIGKNIDLPYTKILADNNIIMPDYYENVCKSIPNGELYTMLNINYESDTASGVDYSSMPGYQISARNSVGTTSSDMNNSVGNNEPVFSLPSDIPDPDTDVPIAVDEDSDINDPQF